MDGYDFVYTVTVDLALTALEEATTYESFAQELASLRENQATMFTETAFGYICDIPHTPPVEEGPDEPIDDTDEDDTETPPTDEPTESEETTGA